MGGMWCRRGLLALFVVAGNGGQRFLEITAQVRVLSGLLLVVCWVGCDGLELGELRAKA
jgi:hypothetical protein